MPMNDVLKTLASEQQKAEVPEIRPGDTVAVSVRVVEGNRERLQKFEGTVLRMRNGGLDEQITVRRIASGVGVERTFLVHSPRVSCASASASRPPCGRSVAANTSSDVLDRC